MENARPAWPRLVPELEVSNLKRSLEYYVAILGFTVLYDRPEFGFAYLELGGAHLMLEEIGGSGRRFSDVRMDPPYGRGINFQIEVQDVDYLYEKILAAGFPVPIPMEECWYRRNATKSGNRQFVAADPDGYLLRFFTDLGRRPL